MGELDGFDAFWSAYPRKVARLAALRKYKQALKLTTPEVLFAAVQKYAAARVGKDVQYTVHASRWLNEGRWEDYAIQALVVPTGFYASFTSAELDAWNAYGRRTKGVNYPQDRSGGWYFPTQWPPGHEAVA